MTNIVIDVSSVGKRFRRPSGHHHPNTLRDTIAYGWRNWLTNRGNSKSTQGEDDFFWALREINFQVREGEVVGLIGRNGAGKSTLLKLLSRISTPTEGLIEMHGRVGALLEVGTGFHPELTGRENVYLNGAILGLRKEEIRQRFDAIVDFSGVENFIDTPVKHYSSGMQARLGFAVAAHLEPEILIVDEVLAVGDAEFQKKCLGKMRDAAGEGRTVLYVSHNLASLNTLCTRGIVLSGGEVSFDGEIDTAVSYYLKDIFHKAGNNKNRFNQRSSEGFRITDIQLKDATGLETPVLQVGNDCELSLRFENHVRKLSDINVGITMTNSYGVDVITVYSIMTGDYISNIPRDGEIVLSLKKLALLPGSYQILFNLSSCGDFISQVTGFEITVIDGDFYGSGKGCMTRKAIYMPECNWSVRTSMY